MLVFTIKLMNAKLLTMYKRADELSGSLKKKKKKYGVLIFLTNMCWSSTLVSYTGDI